MRLAPMPTTMMVLLWKRAWLPVLSYQPHFASAVYSDAIVTMLPSVVPQKMTALVSTEQDTFKVTMTPSHLLSHP